MTFDDQSLKSRAGMCSATSGESERPRWCVSKTPINVPAQLPEPLQMIFNMSLHTGSPGAVKNILFCTNQLSRATVWNKWHVALTPHVITSLNPLQFAYEERLGVEDVVLYIMDKRMALVRLG